PGGEVLLEIDGFEAQAVEGSRHVGGSDLDNALHDFQWQLQSRAENEARTRSDLLPDLSSLTRGLRKAARQSSSEIIGGVLKRDVDRLCAYYIIRALRQLGVELRAGERVAAGSLYAQVLPAHPYALRRLV